MYQFIKSFLDNKMSIFEGYGVFNVLLLQFPGSPHLQYLPFCCLFVLFFCVIECKVFGPMYATASKLRVKIERF